MADIRIQMPLGGVLTPGYQLKKVLNVVVELEDGEWMVIDQTFGQDVIGTTQEETVAAYRKLLVEHYKKVRDEFEKLKVYIEATE